MLNYNPLIFTIENHLSLVKWPFNFQYIALASLAIAKVTGFNKQLLILLYKGTL